MVTEYICNADGCPNAGIVYRMEDAPNGVECGGCHEWLVANE